MALQEPVGHVDDVDILLDDDVAAQHAVHVEVQDAGLAGIHAGLATLSGAGRPA